MVLVLGLLVIRSRNICKLHVYKLTGFTENSLGRVDGTGTGFACNKVPEYVQNPCIQISQVQGE